MKEDKNNFQEEDISGALSRFKRSLITGRKKYFDVSEFEGIVDHLLEEGDINGSEIAAVQGIQIHPNAVALHLKYAQVLLNKGKYEKALKHINLVAKVDKLNPDVYLIKGSAWLVLGNETKAEKAFNYAIKVAGNELDDILYHIGGAFVQAGDTHKAIQYFEKAVQTNPKNETALYELGFFCDQYGNFEKSVKYYNNYLDINPFNYSIWFNLGITYNKWNKHNEAINAYEYALALNDKFHQSIFNIANAHANAGKYQEAIDRYKEYSALYPKNDDSLCYLGECYLNLDEFEKSEEFYKKTIKQNKENDTAWFGLGLIKWVLKDFEESIVFIKKAIKIDDINSEYWLTLGKVNNDNGNNKEAIKALKKASTLDPDNGEVWLTWSILYMDIKQPDDAIRVLKKGIKKNDDVSLKYKMAGILFDIKNEKEGLKILETAMEQDVSKISFLFDSHPKTKKNKKIKNLLEYFQKNNPDQTKSQ